MATTISALDVHDLRFPTSRELDGSDAMNPDPDYSAAYCVLRTAGGPEGHGFTFTIGRGNQLCCQAIEALRPLVVGQSLEAIAADMAGFWRRITGDSQLRWVGPEKGVIHMATGAVVNAVWDLLAKRAGRPLLHHRRPDAGRGAGDPRPARPDPGRTDRAPRGRGLSRLHDLRRLARLLRRQAPRPLPARAGRRLGLLQDQGRP